ncbi:MAG: ribosome silencing factor [Cyanobacteria bacterium NC_groundwater_1444_Ag_S-0.65um_54_12]|nr:ribosome silencing factor [Cyanobacteria bacterium NC_groundwater_1444_Ag_S-0.65um_54_12]
MDYSRQLSELAAQAADEKKARAIALLDLQAVSLLVDYFVLCNGSVPLQVRAIAQHIIEQVSAAGYRLYHAEGMTQGRWVLLDFGVVVVHVMLDREREYYGLERLWSQGRLLPYQASA